MTSVPRPVHLTDAAARTLTRRQILDRVKAEQNYLLGKRRRTDADEAAYSEVMRIMYAYIPPEKLAEDMRAMTEAVKNGTRPPDFWDSRPCDDKPEQST